MDNSFSLQIMCCIYLILGEKAPEVANGFMNEAEGLFSKITEDLDFENRLPYPLHNYQAEVNPMLETRLN